MLQVQRRHRKIAILTLQGLNKLQAAISQADRWRPYPKSITLEALSEKTGLSTHTLSKVHSRQASVDRRTLIRYFAAFNLNLEDNDYVSPIRQNEAVLSFPLQPVPDLLSCSASLLNWGTAPDVSLFYGRHAELATLNHWMNDHHCRLVTLIGMSGMGKTWLATKLAEQMQSQFQVIVWRSLQPLSRSHPPLSFNHFLDDLIRQLYGDSTPILSEPTDTKIRHLTDFMRSIRCLLVLDHVESVLQQCPLTSVFGKTAADGHDSDNEAYSNLLKHLALGRHQSCVVLTSRVEPRSYWLISGNTLSIRALSIRGLPVPAIQQMFAARGGFQGTAMDWACLVNHYNGNPQILSMVARIIQHLFDGNITDFLQYNALLFDELRELLAQELGDVSELEQEVMNVLAIQAVPLSFSDLRQYIPPIFSTIDLLASLKALNARSLIEQTTAHFSLSSMLGSYLQERLKPNAKRLVSASRG